MNSEVRDFFLNVVCPRLESGEIAQIQGQLGTEEGQCCLGVIGAAAAEQGWCSVTMPSPNNNHLSLATGLGYSERSSLALTESLSHRLFGTDGDIQGLGGCIPLESAIKALESIAGEEDRHLVQNEIESVDFYSGSDTIMLSALNDKGVQFLAISAVIRQWVADQEVTNE